MSDYHIPSCQKATHALGWVLKDYKDARGVILLLCSDDYLMTKYYPEYWNQLASQRLADIMHKKNNR